MARETFSIKKGDTLPPINATLKKPDLTPVDLSTATAVYFHMETITPKKATIISAANGQIQVDWNSGDTDVVGKHRAEFQILWASGDVQTVPNDTWIDVEIKRDLN